MSSDVKEPQPRQLVSGRKLAEELAVVPATVARLAREGVIPAVKITSRLTRYDREAVFQALEDSGDDE